MIVDVHELIAIKVYMLYENIDSREDKNKIIDILNACIVSEEYNLFDIDRKLFYLISLCEIYRRTDNEKRLLEYRLLIYKYSSPTVSCYKNIIDKESFSKPNLKTENLIACKEDKKYSGKYKLASQYKITRADFDDFKITGYKYSSGTVIYGYTKIPTHLTDLTNSQLIFHSKYLEETTLFDIIKKHFSVLESNKILAIYHRD